MTKRGRQHLLPGFGLIFRATRTTRSGRVLKAHDYGYRGWPIVVWLEAENPEEGQT
jgi:hypothetical protein